MRPKDERHRLLDECRLFDLARIHGKLDFGRVRSLLLELMEDARTRGYAQDAASDIKMFMGLEL